MATLAATNLTLLDWAKRLDPDGSVPVVAQLLSQTNEMLMDAVFLPGNLPTGHRVTVQTGLPTVYWRAYNQGIPPSKSTTAQIDEACAILEARSEVDIALARLNGNEAAFRLSEARPFVEAMNQEAQDAMIYGDAATDPKKFLGLAGRYSSLSAGNGQNILDCSGTGSDLASVWLICWGEETVFCPFPKGSAAGLVQRDLGEQTIYDGSNRMQGLVNWFQWQMGLVVKDWRYAVRIANIEVSDFAGLTTTQAPTNYANILHKMAIAIDRIPAPDMGRMAFYMNRTVRSGLVRLAMEKTVGALSIEQGLNQFGSDRSTLTFLGVPIRRCDKLRNTESQVT